MGRSKRSYFEGLGLANVLQNSRLRYPCLLDPLAPLPYAHVATQLEQRLAGEDGVELRLLAEADGRLVLGADGVEVEAHAGSVTGRGSRLTQCSTAFHFLLTNC